MPAVFHAKRDGTHYWNNKLKPTVEEISVSPTQHSFAVLLSQIVLLSQGP